MEADPCLEVDSVHLVSPQALTAVKHTNIILQHPCDSLVPVLLKGLVHLDRRSELDRALGGLLLPSSHNKVLLLLSVVFKRKVPQEEASHNKVDSNSRHLVASHSKVSRI